MTRIRQVAGREILDSRGNPTVEVDVTLDDGSFGRAAVPSGASTGAREAVELRDGDKKNWHGRGVSKAVANVNGPIREAVMGLDASIQKVVDQTLIDLDGTGNKGRLGANAILGVSLASMKAAAASLRTPLYRYLGGVGATLLPTPMMNIVNGGAHADNPLDFQEFMIVPVGAKSFYEAVKIGSEVFHTLKGSLAKAGHSTNVGDEGGFAPDFKTAEEALDFVVGAIEQTGYVPGDDVAIALDPAASEFYRAGTYTYGGIGTERSVDGQVEYLISLVERYPILSLEDPVAEDDHEGWQKLTAAIGDRCQLVGDDVFCTNTRLLSAGIAAREANAILVKLNQIGTYSELLQAVDIAKRAGYGVVVSHRSGETEDTTISDIVVGTGVGQLKTGSLSRSDRTAKYNQLLRIEEELGSSARYDGVLPMLASTGRAQANRGRGSTQNILPQ